MKQINWKLQPLKFKLAKYFLAIVFAMIILLWIFQIVFLEGFYKSIKSTQVEQSAKQISLSIKYGDNTEQMINNISQKNGLSVYVYDTSSPIFLKKYSCDYNNLVGRSDFEEHQAYKYYREACNNGGTYLCSTTFETDLRTIQQFQEIIEGQDGNKDKDTTGDESTTQSNTKISPKEYTQYRYENMVYSEIIPLDEDTEYFLVINSMITPVSSVVDTLSVQLIIVSVIVLLLAIVLSFYASHRISKPLSDMNKSAKELAKQNYNVEFRGSGYLEVKELNDTLNYTRQELSKVDKLRQELIANISHDLRTPLTMIKGYGEVMRDLPGENTPENVQIIIDEASRLSTLVTDLLDLSKLQSGTLTLDCEVFCLTDSIRDIFKRYSKLKEQDGYNIEFNECEDVFVNGDELKISQVIYNLMNNAINYAGEDKTVIVTQKVIENNTVRVEVTDHGEGIPPEKLEYIWDRYYKVDKEHKSAVIGTGLGLSIVKNILDLHKAHFGVTSQLGKGSTFWFELPCENPQEKEETTSE